MAMKLEVGKAMNYKSSKALTSQGLVLKATTTAGELDLATTGDMAFGVALKATESPFVEGTYLKGEQVPVAFEGVVELNVISDNASILIGDHVQTASVGQVQRFSPVGAASVVGNDLKKIVGIALDAVANSVGGKIKVRLALHGGQ